MNNRVSKILLKRASKVMRRSLYSLLLMTFIVLSGCSSFWEPTDREAVRLVENYYLFSHRGKKVDVEIMGRAEYVRECKCYPIKFRIISLEQGSYEKTFYFFKNEAGKVEVREYKFGINK